MVRQAPRKWLREAGMLADRYLRPHPRKRARKQQDEDLLQEEERLRMEKKLKILKKKLQRELREELKLYFQETMAFMGISPEGFALCAAQGKKLYAWMAELLKTDPDCLEEVQAIQCDLDFMTDMVDKAMLEIKRWWV